MFLLLLLLLLLVLLLVVLLLLLLSQREWTSPNLACAETTTDYVVIPGSFFVSSILRFRLIKCLGNIYLLKELHLVSFAALF